VGCDRRRELDVPAASSFTTFAFNRHVPSPTRGSWDLLTAAATRPRSLQSYLRSRWTLHRRFDTRGLPLLDLGNIHQPLDHAQPPPGLPDPARTPDARHHREPIEIAPTAHYSMGGVRVRPEDHGTGGDGLYALGEAASGLHGANRLGGNSLIELLVYGRIVGEAAARYSRDLGAQRRSSPVTADARGEVDELLAADGPENVRALQRTLRNTMTEHAGVVRDETGLRKGLSELDDLENRMTNVGVHPHIAGFQDLAHAFDLKAAVLAARATLESALERREIRGCHNRSDYPKLDDSLRVNLVWSGPGQIEREGLLPIPDEIASLTRGVHCGQARRMNTLNRCCSREC
jgi:aspartate oxidase